MVILRDEKRIAVLKKRAQQLTLLGMLFLVGGFVLALVGVQNFVFYQLLALMAGWILSQMGIYLAHRYLRSPRPDEVLDEALKGIVRDGRLYHYLLPAPHVLLTPAGPIVLVPKFQTGKISVQGDKWRQAGLGLRRFFGQESLGNPSREAESMIGALASYIRKHAPSVEEVPIGALIVFTTKNIQELELKGSRIPAMHYSKIKGFLKQKGQGKPLLPADYNALRSAFDEAAAHLPEMVS
ncbi:MAG: hypothetical protein L0332_21620 [Chloroflexi bacterium]|nr:hypothetical protein [Chloroflexota bacterium]MCI0575560.1 hypothetical protein [Chloroflexota bacterium]MCI0649966.1 hypothetical protein [Chloroflexota bacterium]MCI0729296.1 hypothetical protein [Chloroflexota bacterium]